MTYAKSFNVDLDDGDCKTYQYNHEIIDNANLKIKIYESFGMVEEFFVNNNNEIITITSPKFGLIDRSKSLFTDKLFLLAKKLFEEEY